MKGNHMVDLEVNRDRYISLFGAEPTKQGEIERIEEILSIYFPDDFKAISKFYRGGILGTISHNSISFAGPATNITEETLRLRGSIDLPPHFVVLAEEPASLIVLNTKPTV